MATTVVLPCLHGTLLFLNLLILKWFESEVSLGHFQDHLALMMELLGKIPRKVSTTLFQILAISVNSHKLFDT